MHFLITAGGTREYIDPVRFISNAGSGRMGYALARAAARAGHKVTLVTAPTTLRKPAGVEVVRVESAAQMYAAVKKHFPGCRCLIMAAAVSDYTPAATSKTKIKKSRHVLAIKLKPTADILKWAGLHKKKEQIVVGFALEDRHLRERAQKKLKEKNLDMIVANTPDAIAAASSNVQIKTVNGPWLVLDAAKEVIARRIIRLVSKTEGTITRNTF